MQALMEGATILLAVVITFVAVLLFARRKK